VFPRDLTPYAEAMRAAVAVIGWVILLLGVGGEATAHVVSVSLAEPGVHFFSPYKNADAFWLMITLRVTVALLLGGSLITRARARAAPARDTAFPDA
jgi:hypothetical protein